MKFLFDLFPVILFFCVFKIYDIYMATAVAIVTTLIQTVWVWFYHHKIDATMWVSLITITLFGGATLALTDETFIMWKPTVVYGVLAVVLLISNHLFKKNLIRSLLQDKIVLPMAAWNKLNASWVAFFIFMGGINLYVAFNYAIDTWVTFKLFGSTGLMLVFVVLQAIVLARYIKNIDSALYDNHSS